MLTRRGFAVCALCAVTGFLATGAEAENAPGGLKRTILKRIDGPMAGYETVSVRVESMAGTGRRQRTGLIESTKDPRRQQQVHPCSKRHIRIPNP